MKIYVGPYVKCFHNKDPFSVYLLLGGENGKTREMTWLSDDRNEYLYLGPRDIRSLCIPNGMSLNAHGGASILQAWTPFMVASDGLQDFGVTLTGIDQMKAVRQFNEEYAPQIAKLNEVYAGVGVHWGLFVRP